jgi:hypothetical protein
MSITVEKTKELVAKYGKGEKDSGRTEVQIAILTTKINSLTPRSLLISRRTRKITIRSAAF